MRWMRRRGGRREDARASAAYAARRGLWSVARVVSLVTSIVVGLIVLGILLVLLEANRNNEVVDWLLEGGEFLVEPFDNLFTPEGKKARVAVNWGIAAVIYGLLGALITRLLRR